MITLAFLDSLLQGFSNRCSIKTAHSSRKIQNSILSLN
jgi:hypothetical protein